jgi:hypothetical protein
MPVPSLCVLHTYKTVILLWVYCRPSVVTSTIAVLPLTAYECRESVRTEHILGHACIKHKCVPAAVNREGWRG